MRAEPESFPLLAGQSVEERSGLLSACPGTAVNFEPMRVEAGDRLLPLTEDTEYRLALYAPEADPRYLYTYSYPPEANLTRFLPEASEFAWRRGAYCFPRAAYVRVMLKSRWDGTGRALLGDSFCLLRASEAEPEEPAWIAEEAERVARRVRRARRDGDAAFLLLSDTHYAVGCNWPDTARSLARVQERIGAEGLIHLGDFTDGLLPAAWTERYTKRVTEDLRALGLPVWGCLGNHDRNFFRRNTQGLSREDCAKLCLGRAEPDFCVDRPEQRLRLIFLDSFDPQRRERYGFSRETLRHLRRMLRETPAGWRVLVFSHVPPLARLHVWSSEILGSADSPRLRRHSATVFLTPRANAMPAGVPVPRKGTLSSPTGETMAMASEVVPVSM